MTERTIFDIPLIVDAICHNLSAEDIFKCRKICKKLYENFLRPHWRDITISRELTNKDLKTIRNHAQWIHTLTINYSDDIAGTTYILGSTILPVLPNMTVLERIDVVVEYGFNCDFLVQMMCNLPDSVKTLEIDYEEIFEGDLESYRKSHSNLTWKTNKLERICFRGGDTSSNEDLYLIPLIKASPNLKALRIPSVNSEYAEDFMIALGKSNPNLRYLVLNKNKANHSWGYEALYFKYIHQPLKMLRIDMAQDKDGKNIVVDTLLEYSDQSI
ncbi:hypothetical protein FBU30_006555, partial [Linnemannia zychae]